MSVFNKLTDWSGGNYGYLCQALPMDADWVWFMGDDDYLTDPSSLQKICEILIEKNDDPNFKFVHACQSRRSLNSGKVIYDSVMGLCNNFGYTEMLGWISILGDASMLNREISISDVRNEVGWRLRLKLSRGMGRSKSGIC